MDGTKQAVSALNLLPMHPDTAAKCILPEHDESSKISNDSDDLDVPEVMNPPDHLDGPKGSSESLPTAGDFSQPSSSGGKQPSTELQPPMRREEPVPIPAPPVEAGEGA